ncbi:MAG TPA: SBBP repeat-containing protein [Planctomycetota bacterium]|nr:SBBP repeat-containing protein [Planctomycetota bacterium]
MSRCHLPDASVPFPRWNRWWATALAVACTSGLAAAQQHEWTKQLGTSQFDTVEVAIPDGSGGAFFSGILGSTTQRIWFARYDATGTELWTQQLGVSSSDVAQGGASDGSGGALLCGSTLGSLAAPSKGGYDAWFANYDAAGQELWKLQIGTSAWDFATQIALDGQGGFYVAGETYGDLGAPVAGFIDVWVARYDANLEQSWIRQLGTNSLDGLTGMVLDGAGGVVLSGSTNGPLGGPYLNNGDAWMARFDGSGNQTWSKQVGTSRLDQAEGATSDGAGGLYLAGWTEGALAAPTAGKMDAWLGRFDATGAQQWMVQLGSSGHDYAMELATDGSGGVYVIGYTLGSLGGPNAGKEDLWFARYNAQGEQLWLEQFGTDQIDYGRAIASDGAGGFFGGGSTWGDLASPPAGLTDLWFGRWSFDCAPATTYCSSSATSIPGCTAQLSSTGSPQVNAPLSFSIQTSGVPAVNIGLCLFAGNGPASIPFGSLGGVLCVQPPAFRTAAKSSGGGIVPCDGAYAFTLQDMIAAAPIVTAGATIHAQVWARDPANADGFLLSNAVEFSACP